MSQTDFADTAGRSVPYYVKLMSTLTERDIIDNPEACLRMLPILTKDIIRVKFDQLKCEDLARREWYYNTSGGSTSIKLIQDKEYRSLSAAVTMLNSGVWPDAKRANL